MSKRVVGRLATVVLVLALAATGALLPRTAATPLPSDLAPAAAARCADVLVVGAPGDGERRTGASLGPTLDRVVRAVRVASRGQRSVSTLAVPARTRPAAALRGKARASQRVDRAVRLPSVRRWAGDLGGYGTRVLASLERAAVACPGQSLVVLGHAQGAGAVHRALLSLARRAPSAHDQVGAAVLVSDPYRRARSRTPLLGAPAASRATAGVLGRAPVADLPAGSTRFPVLSTCTRGDLVCDRGRQSVRTGLARHQTYGNRAGTRLVAALGSRAFDGVGRTVLPPAAAPRLTGHVGQPVNQALPVRVRAADRGAVRFTLTSPTPPGTTLSSGGVLSGTPTTAGTWTLTYRLANAAAPWTPASEGTATFTASEVVTVQTGRVSAGGQSTCALTQSAALRCWGSNEWGQLGLGVKGGARTAAATSTRWSDWRQVDAGGATTCGIRTDRSLWCWGLNHKGQVGDGTRTDRVNPTRVTAATDWAQVSVDWFTTCATKTDGRAFCWGQNGSGQVGDGTRTDRLAPRQVPGAGWALVETGGWHSCGVRRDGTAACWGRNDLGELGTGGTQDALRPTDVRGGDWSTLSLSWSNTCGVRASGVLQCWGRGDQGAVGDGARSTRTSPTTVAGDRDYASVSVGDSHACGLGVDGRAWCWGSNDYGTLGDGSAVRSATPVPAMPGLRFTSLDAGWMHSCGSTTTGAVTCWGANSSGQLGTGGSADTAARPVPGGPASGPVRFNLATYNVLGNNHTKPRAGDDHFAPAQVRAQWTVDTWENRDLSIIGTQENDRGQIEAFTRAAHGAYAAWPGTAAGISGAPSSVWWRTSDWTAIEKQTFAIRYMQWDRLQPAVRLRSKRDPSVTIWVVNTHLTPGSSTPSQTSRNRAIAVINAKINELRRTGDPVFLTGDLNERTAFCKVARPTGLTSPRGGSVRGTTCTPPSGSLRIDWIFGPAGVWDQYTEVQEPLRMRTNDHRLITSRVTLG